MYMGGNVAPQGAAVWLIAHDKTYSDTVHYRLNTKMLSAKNFVPNQTPEFK